MDRTRFPASTLILSALVFFVFLFVFFIYTFLHEGGHAITGLLFGLSLTEFDVSFWDLSAHVGLAGGTLTDSQLAIRSAAGTFLPFLVWVVFICLVPRKGSFTLETLKLLSSMIIVNTLLAWVALPVLFMLGKAPSDDVTYFLRYSHLPPWLVTLAAIIFYIAGWKLYLSKIDGLRNAFLMFRTNSMEAMGTGIRTTLPVMTVIAVVCAILTFRLNILAVQNPVDRFAPPQDFSPVAEIDLSERAYPSETIGQFTLEEATYVGVFLVIRDINTTFFDLSVIGTDGFSSTVLHGEGYNTHQDGGLWEQNLQPGAYQIVLTSHQSPGSVSLYLKTH